MPDQPADPIHYDMKIPPEKPASDQHDSENKEPDTPEEPDPAHTENKPQTGQQRP